ncbi:MAG: cellulase family glycosylhydrolase [Fibrobacteraceae bacterium]|nr:cellulase family glycosylhydrolase [Fibrobacteraceae bacterium]
MKSIISKTLLILGCVAPSLFAEQVLVNNDFKSGLSGWSTQGTGFTAVAGSDEWGSFINMNITDGGANPWDVKLYQDGITLEPGYEYTMEWGATRASGNIAVGLGMSAEPYTDYMSDRIEFSGSYLEHTIANGEAVTLHYCGEAVSGLRFYMDLGGNNASARTAWASIGKEAKACNGSDPSGPLTNPGNGPVPYYGELKVSGNRIIGARSKSAVQVRGMSLYWSLWGGERFYNASAIKTLVDDWKVEVVRAAMGVDQEGGYNTNPEEQKALVSAVVDAAIANEIYVIIDFHCHVADQYSTQAKEFFSYMAQKYGKYDNVIFEVYNEPLNISWGTIKNYAVGVISEIRKYSDNLVIVGTPNWSQDVDAVVSDRISATNVAYTLHFYAGSHGSDLMAKARTALNSNLALFVTEWGTVNADGDGNVATASSNDWMTFMDQNKLSWANWSLNDKAEGASVFVNGISTTGTGWTTWNNLTASGQYVYGKLTGYASSALWRSAPKETAIAAPHVSKAGSVVMNLQQMEYQLGTPNAHQALLFDTRGRVVWSAHQPSGNGTYHYGSMGILPAGAYILKLHGVHLEQTVRVSVP